MKTLNSWMLLLSIPFTFLTCNTMKKPALDVAWTPSVCAPKDYPVMVISGVVTTGKVGGVPIMREFMNSSNWGEISGRHISINSRSIPNGLGIRWYSYVENKFYGGFFDLPVEKLTQLFAKRFVSMNGKKANSSYNHVLVGMAPKGYVHVWLYGDGTVSEVGIFQAEEISMTLHEFDSHMWEAEEDQDAALAEWRAEHLEENKNADSLVRQHVPIPDGLWKDKYREKFLSRVVFKYGDPNALTDMYTVRYFNGEAEVLSGEALKSNALQERPRFWQLIFKWSFGRELRKTFIYFDQAEMEAAYTRLYNGQSTDLACELRVDVNPENNFNRVYLQLQGAEYPKAIELLKADIGIYPLGEHSRFMFEAFADEFYVDGLGYYKRKDGRNPMDINEE